MGATLTRRLLVAALVLAAVLAVAAWPAGGRAAEMPCKPPNHGFVFDTFEPENYQAVYGAAVELATAGKAVTFSYTPAPGEAVDLRFQGLKSGPRVSRASESMANSIPPTVYKSIAWIESNWADGSAAVPYGGVGPTLVSGDCGYGIGQITSGMGHLAAPPAREPGVPSARQAVIGTDFVFNIAAGVQILADKWNAAPALRPIAGYGDPSALEDWYYAIWAYNGFAFSNHPLNPDLDPLRGAGTSFIYHCYDPSAPSYQDTGSGPKYQYGDYTYAERVYGCMRFPPKAKATISSSQLVADAVGPRFKPGDAVVVSGSGGCTNLRSGPVVDPNNVVGCLNDGTRLTVLGGPASGSGYTWWNVHTPKGDGWMADQFLALAPPPGSTPTPTSVPTPAPTGPPSGTPPVVDPSGRMWLPQVFNMPDFSKPDVAEAFAPGAFEACDNNGFSDGCPGMDFPTSFPLATPPVPIHHDSTPPTDPSWASRLLGNPRFQYSGPTSASLRLNGDGTATSVTVTVKNVGSWIAPFRVRTSANWILVHHPSDPAGTEMNGGVAIGKETDVVTQPASSTTQRVAQKGYDSVLTVTLDPSLLPGGVSTGTVWIEPLLGSGTTFQVAVTATNLGAGPGAKYRAVAPAIASDAP